MDGIVNRQRLVRRSCTCVFA